MRFIFFNLIICLLLLNGCGFKTIDYQAKYIIGEIQTEGNKRINYILKNKLKNNSSKNDSNVISIRLNSKKNKSVKEKNIKNEITKYNISIITNVEYNFNSEEIFQSFSIKENGDFIVAKNYSQTINNEKKLIELLASSISDQISRNLAILANDL